MTNKELIILVNEVNKECFNNKIDLCFAIKFFYSKKLGGQFRYSWSKTRENQKEPRCTWFLTPVDLRISSYFKFNNYQLKNIIAHELIHALELQIKFFKSKNCHGSFFKKHMERINKNFGYSITVETNLRVLNDREVEII